MHSRNHHDQGNGDATNWSAFVTGALIGAGVALLFAPQTGRELRDMLGDYANRTKDDLLDKAEEAYDKGEEVIRDAGQPQGNTPNRDSRRAGQSIKEFA